MASLRVGYVSEGTWRGLKGAGPTCCPVAPPPTISRHPLPMGALGLSGRMLGYFRKIKGKRRRQKDLKS